MKIINITDFFGLILTYIPQNFLKKWNESPKMKKKKNKEDSFQNYTNSSKKIILSILRTKEVTRSKSHLPLFFDSIHLVK